MANERVSAPAVAALEEPDELAELLARSPSELEREASAIARSLRRSSSSVLRLHAPRLLALLDDPRFGTEPNPDGVFLREVVVLAIDRVGFPFILQLAPGDLEWTRRQAKVEKRATVVRRAKWLVAAALALLIAVPTARLAEKIVHRKRAMVVFGYRFEAPARVPLTLATVEEAVPDLEQRMQALIRSRSTKRAIVDDGLGCLALGWSHRNGCLSAIADALEAHAQDKSVEDSKLTAQAIRELLVDDELAPAAFRERAAEVMAELDRLGSLPAAPDRLTPEQAAAREVLTRGDFEGFLSGVPFVPGGDSVEWLLARFTALRASLSADGVERAKRDVDLEDVRARLVRALAQQRQYDCLRAPDPSPTRPLGCP